MEVLLAEVEASEIIQTEFEGFFGPQFSVVTDLFNHNPIITKIKSFSLLKPRHKNF